MTRPCTPGNWVSNIVSGQETMKLKSKSTNRCLTASFIWDRWKTPSISTHAIAWEFLKNLTHKCDRSILVCERTRRGPLSGAVRFSMSKISTGKARPSLMYFTRTSWMTVVTKRKFAKTWYKAKHSLSLNALDANFQESLQSVCSSRWAKCCAKITESQSGCPSQKTNGLT